MQFLRLNLSRSIVVCSALALFTFPASAQIGFAKVDGLRCGSLDPRYSDWCELLNFSWGNSNQVSFGSSGGGTSGTSTIGDANLMKNFDRASPKFFEYMASGRHIRDVLIVLLDRTTKSELLRITLTDVIISAVNYGPAQEGISLAFGKVEILHVPTGTHGGWDLIRNTIP